MRLKIREIHLLWYLCGIGSLTYLYLLNMGTMDLLLGMNAVSLQKILEGSSVIDLQNSNVPLKYREKRKVYSPSEIRSYLDTNEKSEHLTNFTLKKRIGQTNVSNTTPLARDEKYLIYICTKGSRMYCGGLTDRFIGMVSAYLSAEIMGRKFGILVDFPCALSTFLRPNLVNWRIDRDGLVNRTSHELIHLSNDGLGRRLKQYMKDYKDTDILYYRGNVDVVARLKANGLIQYVPWAKNKDVVAIYKTAMDKLFRHSRYLQDRYEEFKMTLTHDPEDLVCAHLRMGRSETFKHDTNITLKLRPNPKSVLWFLKERCRRSPSDVFVATDSYEIRDMFKMEFPSDFRETEGEITHIDQLRGRHHCDGMGKAILDQYVLSTCKTLVMSDSGFSRLAAIMRGTDDDLHLALHNGQIIPYSRGNPSVRYKAS